MLTLVLGVGVFSFLPKSWQNGLDMIHAVRAEVITELIPERVGPVIFKTLLLELIAFRPIPVVCPARRTKPENYWKQ